MSSTGRGAERIDYDAYYTDERVARAVVRALDEDSFISTGWGPVLEPSAGKGAWVEAIADRIGPKRIDAVDLFMLDPRAGYLQHRGATGIFQRDFLEHRGHEYSLILGNPPFKHAREHIAHAMSLLAYDGRLVFLLRSAFVESTKRQKFWRKYPLEHEYRLVERPSFTGGETDSCAYSVFVWHKIKPLITIPWTSSFLSWK